MKENATPSSLDGPLHGGFSKFLVNGKRPIRHAMVGDKALWWHECVQPPLLLRKNHPLAAQLKPPFGHSCYWAAHRVGPVITSAFGRLCRKTITRGSEDTRSGTKKRCSQHLFHTIFPSSNFFLYLASTPAPLWKPEGVANQQGYLRWSKRFDHITDHRKESLYKFFHCSNLSHLRASLCKILISNFAHKMDFAHNFSVDFF